MSVASRGAILSYGVAAGSTVFIGVWDQWGISGRELKVFGSVERGTLNGEPTNQIGGTQLYTWKQGCLGLFTLKEIYWV